MENIIFNLIKSFCFNILDININTTNNTKILMNIFNYSILMSIFVVFVGGVFFIFYKKLTFRGFILEYKRNFIFLLISIVLNYSCFWFLDDFLTNNISNLKKYFISETKQSLIFLLLFTLSIIILILRQLTEIIEFEMLMILQPFLIFDKTKEQKLINFYFNLIIESIILSTTYFIIQNISNLNMYFLTTLILGILTIQPKKINLFVSNKINHYEVS